MEVVFFFLFALVAVASAVLVVLFRNPVHSVLSLVTTLFCLAGLFVLLDAHFLAAVQVIVYAGAITVLFLFVIMLLNLGHSDVLEPATGKSRLVTVLLVVVALLAELAYMAGRQMGAPPASEEASVAAENVHHVGELLYTDYLFPFEVASMILLVALVGVIVLVKQDRKQPAAQR